MLPKLPTKGDRAYIDKELPETNPDPVYTNVPANLEAYGRLGVYPISLAFETAFSLISVVPKK
jgi:hypothetical protein